MIASMGHEGKANSLANKSAVSRLAYNFVTMLKSGCTNWHAKAYLVRAFLDVL